MALIIRASAPPCAYLKPETSPKSLIEHLLNRMSTQRYFSTRYHFASSHTPHPSQPIFMKTISMTGTNNNQGISVAPQNHDYDCEHAGQSCPRHSAEGLRSREQEYREAIVILQMLLSIYICVVGSLLYAKGPEWVCADTTRSTIFSTMTIIVIGKYLMWNLWLARPLGLKRTWWSPYAYFIVMGSLSLMVWFLVGWYAYRQVCICKGLPSTRISESA